MTTQAIDVCARESHQRFWNAVLACLGVLFLIHLLPKSRAPDDSMRMLYTAAYFGALLMLAYLMLGPRHAYLEALYAWRYADAPPSLERLWRRYLHAQQRLAKPVAWLALAFAGSVAVTMLGRWMPELSAFSGLAKLAFWLAIAGTVALLLLGEPLASEVLQARRLLRDELAAGRYQPRAVKDLKDGAAGAARTAVVVTGSQEFQAGDHAWSWDEMSKNMVVFGQTGSGKTVCVLNALLDGILASAPGPDLAPGGLLLDPKGDFAGKIGALADRYGRARDVVTIDPSDPDSVAWNPLDSDDDAQTLAARMVEVMKALGMKDGQTSFWNDSARKFMRNAITLLRLTNEGREPPALFQIGRLASSFDALADRTDRLDPGDPRAANCLAYFADEWSTLAEETRSSIQAHITNMVDPFIDEPVRSKFSGRSTVRLADAIEAGRIVYVHMPLADRTALARTVGTLVKLEYFREVRKRLMKPRPTFFLCDEFQAFFTTEQGSGDADFFEVSRQSNHANVIATQNLPALMKACPPGDQHTAKNLLGHCVTKVFLRNTDIDTNEWASKLFGQHIVGTGGVSAGGGAGRSRAKSGVQITQSKNDAHEAILRPEQFTRLGIPSYASGATDCEAFIHFAAAADMDALPRRHRWDVHPIVD